MPFYRIVIKIKSERKPKVGIRQYSETDIDKLYRILKMKAEEIYRNDFDDFDVQMISKLSTAVREHLNDIEKKSKSPDL